ncbi:TauD/TfdA family dioxygenase [Streptomyces sp. Je 1-369]|uniref:TauD/TfdA family dioxygenase n=1 Tax=Streptomyces sp. Je 1-369 TaxID=2966192 RepID=UPI0022860265|nr:TauD/TfdA family dioxygenase [Streptomyces sp. Je 1-369]WAL96412.1 TauD/TfdA family dioxygenase [Streptomyces sp. Je 1-369]
MTGIRTAPTAVAGDWLGADLSADPEQWRLPVPRQVADELLVLARDSLDKAAEKFPDAPLPGAGPATRALAGQVHRRLAGFPGFVQLTGFPVNADFELVEAAYSLFGRLIGPPVSQTRAGNLIARVEDQGAKIAVPTQRGHHSSSALAFHADRTDVIGLLCIRAAAEGGHSQLVSSKALHNLALRERPDLLAVLYEPFPHDQRGEAPPGRPGWCELPVFSRFAGDFAARYVRRFVEGSQRHARAPRLTAEQVAAMDFMDELLHRHGVALQMELQPGDIQWINNFHILHSRSAFRDAAGPDGGRLLLRLWLSFAGSPALPPEYADMYGSTEGGAYRGGVCATGAGPTWATERGDHE